MAPDDTNSAKRSLDLRRELGRDLGHDLGRELGDVGSAVRWTLGNLDQAFEQALDEAFRTCISLVDELGNAAAGCGALAEPELAAIHAPIHPAAHPPEPRGAEAERFRSCEGPITDGEPGEGFQLPPEPGIVAA